MSPENTDQSKAAELPGKYEIRKRLESVIPSDDGDIQKYYLKVLELAGKKIPGKKLGFTLILASADYMEDYILSEATRNLIRDNMPQIIKSLVDDEEVRQDALDYWQDIAPKDGETRSS